MTGAKGAKRCQTGVAVTPFGACQSHPFKGWH